MNGAAPEWTVASVDARRTVTLTRVRLGDATTVDELTPGEALRLGYELISAGRVKAGLEPL